MDIEYEYLPFLLQAPSQGVVCCASLAENEELTSILARINHQETNKCTKIERDFLRHLEGGCTAPIGARATISGNNITFEGRIASLDGSKEIDLKEVTEWNDDLGVRFAQQVLDNGGKAIMEEIKPSYKTWPSVFFSQRNCLKNTSNNNWVIISIPYFFLLSESVTLKIKLISKIIIILFSQVFRSKSN